MAPSKHTILPGSARPRSSSSRLIQKVKADEDVIFTVFVRRMPGGPALPSLEHWHETPTHRRQFLTRERYAELYGASATDIQATTTGLRKFGMTVLDQHQGARTVTVRASPPQIAAAFRVTLNHYQSISPEARLQRKLKSRKIELSTETETHIGYDGTISVPSELAGIVVQIVGLDTRSIAVPGGFSGDPANSVIQTVPAQAALYNFPNTGASDQTIGVFSGGGSYLASDISTYFASMPTAFGTAPSVVDVGLTVGTNSYSNSPSSVSSITSISNAPGAILELTQDILTSATIAQGCTTNVYFTDTTEQGWVVFLNRVLFPQNEKQPNSVTISWIIFDEHTYGSAFSNLFQQLAAIGVSVFAAVGDWGSDDNDIDGNAHVGYPGSDPWVTGVGGTVVGNVNAGPPVTFQEFVWSDEHNSASNFSFTGGGTTGGGMSSLFPTPAYQSAASVTSFTDSGNNVKTGGRFVPDIAGMVGYQTFFCSNLGYNFIGTSCAAPLYAGLFAVLRSSLGTSLGFLNPLLYELGRTAFNDVTFGNNDSGDAPDAPYFSAATGYDPTTGWGSVDGTKMHASLAKLLFPRDMYITVIKNSFGLAEVEGQATWAGTLFITLDGFAPKDLPATGPTVVTTLGSDAVATVGNAVLQISADPASAQRILFPVTIVFGPKSAHAINDPTTPGIFPAAGSTSPIEKVLVADLVVGGQSFEAVSSIELLAGADPFFSNLTNTEGISNVGDSHAWYLSDDLRVFTVCPGINAAPVSAASVPGAPALSPTSLTGFDSSAGYSYITNLLNYLNGNFTSRTGTDAFTLLPDQSNALTEDSLVAPSQIDPANSSEQFANYTFAIARVRSNSTTSGEPVKVFFRLFTSNNPQTWFLPATAYLSTPAAPSPPEAPLVASDMTSIPFFASGNFGANTDYDATGINNKVVASAGDSYTYFGCYFNVYATDDTITFNGQTKPVSGWLNGGHQCLVAQIAFDNAPITEVNGILAGPMNSDKLAQRNLQVTLSDNPGPPDAHLVPQAFDTAPTPPPPANPTQFMDKPDELMIDWGNAPVGSTCMIYWPQINAADLVALADKTYENHQLSVLGGDPNTITTPVIEGFSLIPIPFGNGPNFAGLVTIQLPQGVVQGQEFLITMRRIATRFVKTIRAPQIARTAKSSDSVQSFVQIPGTLSTSPDQRRGPPITATNWRYTAGMFAVKIPVTNGRRMLPIDRDNQAITAWRLNQMSTSDRWYPVMQRYLSYLTRRIHGLGGGKLPVVPSPIGAVMPPERPCSPHGTRRPHRPGHKCEPCHCCRHCHQCSQPTVGNDDHDHDKCHAHKQQDSPICPSQHHCEHCKANYRNCHHRGKIDGLRYNRFGDLDSFVMDCDDGKRREVSLMGSDTEKLVIKLWEARNVVEVKTAEDRLGRLESITVLKAGA